MIKIDENGIEGEELDSLGYIKGRIGISRIILPVTCFLRAINAEKLQRIKEGTHYFSISFACIP